MQKRWFLAATALAGLGLLGLGAAGQAAPDTGPSAGHKGKPDPTPGAKPTVPTWHPDPKLMAQLAPVRTIGGYAVQPPTGYVYRLIQNGPFTGYGWQGAVHPNGVFPAFYITVITIPPEGRKDMTLDHALASVQKTQATYEPDVTFSAPEYGTVNGLSFVRVFWKGHDPQNVLRHGLICATIDGNTACILGGQDSEPFHATSLPVMEAAMLTFHKNAGP